MSIQPAVAAPARKSAAAGALGVILTLGIFVIVFLAFLISPLLALGAAFLGYTVLRPRARKSHSSGPGTDTHVIVHGFGAGTQ